MAATYRYRSAYLRRYRYRGGQGSIPAPVVWGAAAVLALGAGSAATTVHHGHGHPAVVVAAGAGNVALGQALAARRGWTGGQFTCLYSLWNRESGWSQYADTRRTGAGGDGPGSTVFAYGIAQARPATKMPRAAWPADLGGQSNRIVQIRWGLGYIASTYGTPCGAWSHETAYGWY